MLKFTNNDKKTLRALANLSAYNLNYNHALVSHAKDTLNIIKIMEKQETTHILIDQDEQIFADKIINMKINLDGFPENSNGFAYHFKRPIKLGKSLCCGIFVKVVDNQLITTMQCTDKSVQTSVGNGISFEELIDRVTDNGQLMPHSKKRIGFDTINYATEEELEESFNPRMEFMVKLVIASTVFESLDSFVTLSGVWRDRLFEDPIKNKKTKYAKLNLSSEIKRSVTWHFRQLRAERYYRGEHADKPRGSRWIFVAPDLNDDDKAKHIPETGFKNKDEAKRVVESVQAA